MLQVGSITLGIIIEADGNPHMQDNKPPIPSRFVQTREATAKALSDTYNGDSKIYAALRAAVYLMYGLLSQIE